MQDVLDKHEADGMIDSTEYQAAVTKFYSIHVCRLDPYPKGLLDIFARLEEDPTVYNTM